MFRRLLSRPRLSAPPPATTPAPEEMLWTRRDVAALAMLLLTLLLSNHELLRGQTLPTWDADSFFSSAQMLVADHARQGRLVLWNPWSNAGSPDFADPQIGAFSPLCVVVGLITGGKLWGFVAYWMTLWTLGVWGLYVLGRWLGAPVWGALIVALGWMFSGYWTGHAQHVSHIHSMAFVPWVLWRLDVALLRSSWLSAAQAGALWGASALAGYPGLTVITAGFASLWALGRWFEHAGAVGSASPGRPSLRWAFFCVAALALTGLIVLSPTYIGYAMEMPGYSYRAGPLTRLDAVESNTLHPGALLTFASPYFMELWMANHGRLFTSTDVSSLSIYQGAWVVFLAPLALLLEPRHRWRWWWAAMIVLCLATAMSRVFPVRGWLYDLLPPFRYFRHAAVFRGYAMLGVAVLALHATADLQRLRRWGRSLHPAGPSLLAVGLALAALASLLWAWNYCEQLGNQATLALLHAGAVWAALPLLALVLVKRFSSPRPGPWIALALALAVGDALASRTLSAPVMELRREKFRRYWQLLDADHQSAIDLLHTGPLRGHRINSHWLSNKHLSVKAPVLECYTPLAHPVHLRWVTQAVLVRSVVGLDRFWFTPAAPRVAPTLESFASFLRRAEELQAMPVVLHERADLLGSDLPATDAQGGEPWDDLPAAIQVPARWIEYRPNVMHLRVTCPEAGHLLVTDRWARSWRATVNGEPAEVLGGNFIFRVVRVAGGENDVRFEYHPPGFPGLVILSWGTLGAVGLLSVLRAIRPRPPLR